MDSGGEEDAGDGAFGNPLSVDVEEAAYATLPVCGRGHDALHISTVDLDSDDSLLLGVDGNLSGLVLHVIQAGVQGIDLADGERRHGGLTVRGSSPADSHIVACLSAPVNDYLMIGPVPQPSLYLLPCLAH